MGLLSGIFGDSSKSSTSATTTENLTTNTDNRMALQDAVGVGAGGSYLSSSYSSSTDSHELNWTTADSHDMALADSHNFADSSVKVDNSVTYAADAHVLDTLAYSMPDSVKALAGYGSDVLSQMGGAVVDLNRDSMAQNARSFDAIVQAGSGMVDKIIGASVQTAQLGNQLAATAVQSFEPVQNKAADTSKYVAWGAAAVVALVVLVRGGK